MLTDARNLALQTLRQSQTLYTAAIQSAAMQAGSSYTSVGFEHSRALEQNTTPLPKSQ